VNNLLSHHFFCEFFQPILCTSLLFVLNRFHWGEMSGKITPRSPSVVVWAVLGVAFAFLLTVHFQPTSTSTSAREKQAFVRLVHESVSRFSQTSDIKLCGLCETPTSETWGAWIFDDSASSARVKANRCKKPSFRMPPLFICLHFISPVILCCIHFMLMCIF
jgi:hypothetical protein